MRFYREARAAWTGRLADLKPTVVRQLQQRYPDLKVSERSLDRWNAAYRDPADAVNLVDRRGGDQKGAGDAEFWKFLQSIYLDPRRPKLKGCWRRARDEAIRRGWSYCSYDQCRRRLDDVIPPQLQAQFRDGALYRSAFKPYIEQDPDAYAAGERYDLDHCIFDMWVRDTEGGNPYRPWLTMCIDWKSRRIMGWCISKSPSSSTIMATLRMALTAWESVPRYAWIDNGKDFDCYALHGMTKRERQRQRAVIDELKIRPEELDGVFPRLGIEAHFSIPHNPNGKSRVERLFGTMHEDFDKSFRTYAGKDPASRPDNLADILKHPHLIPTLEHVIQRFEQWVIGYNACAEHRRKDVFGYSPDQYLGEFGIRRPLVDAAALDLILQHWSRPVGVGKNGVSISPRGRTLSYGQFEPALANLKRTKRRVRVSYDLADLSSVRVFDEQGRFLCVARMNNLGHGVGPVSGQLVGELIAEQRRHRAKKREVAQNAHYEYLSQAELIADRAIQEQRRGPTHDGPIQLVQTPLDGASQEVRRHEERRSKAGRESKRPRRSLLEMLEPFRSPMSGGTQSSKAPARRPILEMLDPCRSPAAADDAADGASEDSSDFELSPRVQRMLDGMEDPWAKWGDVLQTPGGDLPKVDIFEQDREALAPVLKRKAGGGELIDQLGREAS